MPSFLRTYEARRGRPLTRIAVPAAVSLAVIVTSAPAAFAAQGPIGLGKAGSFAVLAGSGVSNTGPTTVTGDIGTFPTPSETGMSSVTLSGTNHDGDAVTQGAKKDLQSAYNDAAGRTPVTNVPVELGGTTLLPGVYTSPTFGLTGTLTLDAKGDPKAEFIFQAGSTLITASNSRVRIINSGDACNVVWQVGSSATFGTGTAFIGDVLAHDSVTAQTGATFDGPLLALGGAVTLDTNTITSSTCSTATSSSSASSTASSTASSSTSASATSSVSVPPTSSHHRPSASGTGTAGAQSGRGGSRPGSIANSGSLTLPFTGLPTGPTLAVAVTLMLLGVAMTRTARSARPRRHPLGAHQA